MRIAYTRPDGGISIVAAAPKEHLERVFGPLTDKQYRAHVIERSIPADALDVQELPDNLTLPEDRTFRNAWRMSDKSITVDMPAAREIWRERMRQSRAPKLAALDVEYQRADEAGDAQRKRQIAAQKQALRDISADPRIEAAQKPDELKAVWPDILK